MHLNIRTGVKHGALRISKHPLRDHHLLAILKTKGKKNSSLFRSTSFSLSSVLLSIFFLFSLHVFFYQTDQSLLPPPPNPSMKSPWRFMNFANPLSLGNLLLLLPRLSKNFALCWVFYFSPFLFV